MNFTGSLSFIGRMKSLTKKTRIFAFAILALTVGIVGMVLVANTLQEPSCVQEMIRLSEILEEGQPAYTATEADTIVNKVVPLIERSTGRTFKRVPVIRISRRMDVPAIIERNIPKGFEQENTEADAVAQHSEMMGLRTVGIYGKNDKALYLFPRNLRPLLRALEIEEKHTQAVGTLIIVHELVHALQDQQIDLSFQYRQARGRDETMAFKATVEGHALFYEELVAKQLNLQHVIPSIIKMYKQPLLEFDEPVHKMKAKAEDLKTEFLYFKGREFVEYHYKKGGNRRVWNILKTPPRATSMILAPGAYLFDGSDDFPYSSILEVRDTLIVRKRTDPLDDTAVQFSNSAVGGVDLFVTLGELNPTRRDELLSQIKHVQALEFLSGVLRLGAIKFFLMEEEEYGPSFVSTLEGLKKSYVERLKGSRIRKVEGFSAEDFERIAADASRKIAYTHKPPKGEPWEPIKSVFFYVCRGDVVLEYEDNLMSFTDSEVADLAELIFDRYEAAKQQYRTPKT